MTSAILAIDQGTTNSKAVLISSDGDILSRGGSPVGISHPQPGWVEQDPQRIWESVQEAVAACRSGGPDVEIVGIALTNQRESVTVWDASTGGALGPVVSWQCRRTAPACADLIDAGHADLVSTLTGLPIDPMFPGPKMRWLLDRIPPGRAVRLGTIDSWLIHCLTGGAVHACDASNAARSQLFDLQRQCWSDDLSGLFDVPLRYLPEVRDSTGDFGVTRRVPGLPDGIPIRSAIGDSHAALLGHGAFRPGDGKVTFGTGASVMTTLPAFVAPRKGITTTVAWRIGGKATFAFEGTILVSAAALSWMANILGLPDVQALTDLAATAEPGGAGFVPAFVGLGAPYWSPDARALFSQITFNTTRADLARAVTDSIAYPVHDIVAAMNAQSSTPLGALYVDGGPSQNKFLMQNLANVLGRAIVQRDAPEASAIGAAYLAGLSLGVWPNLDSIAGLSHAGTTIEPLGPLSPRPLSIWRDAVERSTGAGSHLCLEE